MVRFWKPHWIRRFYSINDWTVHGQGLFQKAMARLKKYLRKFFLKLFTIACSRGGREDSIHVFMTPCCKWKSATKSCSKIRKINFFEKVKVLVALLHLQHGVINTWIESSRPPLEHAIVLKNIFWVQPWLFVPRLGGPIKLRGYT